MSFYKLKDWFDCFKSDQNTNDQYMVESLFLSDMKVIQKALHLSWPSKPTF
jgi:hypothetical protein